MDKDIIFIYSPQTSVRLQYIASILFAQFLDVDFQILTDETVYKNKNAPKINYSNQSLVADEIQIANHGLLFEKSITQQELNVTVLDELSVLFYLPNTNATFPFDLFSMAFFLLSRYEEYLPFSADQHGRYPAERSIAYRYQFLQQPIIELWLVRLRQRLSEKYAELNIPVSTFQFLPTYDIDLAWAYLHRPWWRSVPSLFRNIAVANWQIASEQYQVWRRKRTDPYDTFAFLDKLHQDYRLQPIYFFLLGDYAKYDKNINPQNLSLQILIQNLSKQYQVGIHPSYQSNNSLEILTKEVRRLQFITQQSIVDSRQHFLKLHLPETYQRLIALNIKHDHSMGYAGQIGFRASVSRPYFWYDLQRERMTDLLIHPFSVMDVTLQQYLQLTPTDAISLVKKMIKNLQETGGTFTTLWHNSSFSSKHGWEGWKNVYQQIVELASCQIIE